MQWSVACQLWPSRTASHLRALTDVALQVLLAVSLTDVAVLILVVVLVDGLPDQVQAVQLMEDFHRCSITFLARMRMLDLEQVLRKAQSV